MNNPQIKLCRSCNNKLDSTEFISEGKEYATCNCCRKSRSIKTRKNICQTCGLRASFNLEGETTGIYCNTHKELGMVDVTHDKCIVCKKKRPNFNYDGETKATHCKECSLKTMIDIRNTKCIVCKKKQPTFNYEGEIKATHCKDCCLENMIDIKHEKCIVCKKKRPNFNYEGSTKATHCKNCCLENMIDIKHEKCIVCKKKRPNFNYEGSTKATHCKDCCLENMIDITHPKCVVCKKKQPIFNYVKEVKPTHCKDCSLKGMINIIDKKCIVCKSKIPIFNLKNEIQATHCKECADVDMIDIKNPKCNVCNTRANFGYINQSKTHCARHKLPLMFKMKYSCQECDNVAEYGDQEPTHCFTHQKENQLCLLGQKCKQCLRENELCNKYKICLTYCKPTETTINIKKIIKKKEALVLSYIDNNLKTDFKSIDDRIVDTSCVNRRPDRLYDCGTHFVIVEVDENGNNHSSAPAGCIYDKKTQEQRRMVQIFEALSLGPDVCDNRIISHIPVIFIRFNPDNFRVKGKLQKVNMQKRLEMLIKWIDCCIKYDIEKLNTPISIKYLFYDNYDETNLEFENIKLN